MAGAVAIVVVVVVVLPALFLLLGGVLSAVVGCRLKEEAERVHEGSELAELYR